MSFTVKAGTTSPGPSFQNVSPHLNSAVSPFQRSSSTSIPPPFSLATSTEAADHNSKRSGTDPTKYKTTICRNWEQTGSCGFRGCTFAHGVDDLRPPVRNNTSPVLAHQPSPGATPPLYPQGLTGSGTSTSTSLPTSATGGGAPPAPRAEQLVEMLMTEIYRERDLVSVHTEANKTLESMLRKEQMHHAETASRAEGLQNQAAELARQVSERNAEILRLLEVCGDKLSLEQRRRAESLTSWNFGNTEGLHLPSSSSRAERHNKAGAHQHHHDTNSAAAVWDDSQTQMVGVSAVTGSAPSPTSDQLRDLLLALRTAQS